MTTIKGRRPALSGDEAAAFARRVKDALDAGGKVWVNVSSVSRSGLSYTITARLIHPNGDIWLNYWLGYEMGLILNESDHLKAGGYGTDRGFLLADWVARGLKNHGLDVGNGNNINWGWF